MDLWLSLFVLTHRLNQVDEDGDTEEDARPRQRQHIEASDAEQDEDMSDEDTEMNGAASGADDQMAKKLVRYAISCEYSRTPIKRDGIKERGIGTVLIGTMGMKWSANQAAV